jgi:hypothetical protein
VSNWEVGSRNRSQIGESTSQLDTGEFAQDQLTRAEHSWELFPDDYLDGEAWVCNDYQELIVRMPPHRSPAGAALFASSYLSELLAGVAPDLRKDSWQLEGDEVYMRLRRCILHSVGT